MKTSGLTLLFSLIWFSVSAQWTPKFTLEEPADFIAADNLLNLYRVYQSEIVKYDPKGQIVFRYSDKQLGPIGSLDVSYPLRPLVLYPDLNFLVILDNTLSSRRGKINLTDHNIGNATLACTSVQNHYWIYDAMQFALLRTDEKFNTISTTGNLSQILGITLDPISIREYGNKVYLNNPGSGILVFDIFGTYLQTIPIINVVDFQVFENNITYFTQGKLVRYDTLTFQSTEIPLPEKCLGAYLQKNRLFIRTAKNIKVYSKSEP